MSDPHPAALPPLQSFNEMLCSMRFGVFFFFAGFVALMTTFVAAAVPETKGVPIEEVEAAFAWHWLWGPCKKLPPVVDGAAEEGSSGEEGNLADALKRLSGTDTDGAGWQQGKGQGVRVVRGVYLWCRGARVAGCAGLG